MNSLSPDLAAEHNGQISSGDDNLTAQIAHDLRNALTALLGTVSLIKDAKGLPPAVISGLATIEKAAVQARSLSLQLAPSKRFAQDAKITPQIPLTAEVPPSCTPLVAKTASNRLTRILAMDDEPGIRALLTAALAHFGYEATTVPDGADALREYQRALNDQKPFAVVIMDLTVPGGMGGKEVIKALKQIDPGVRAIVSSGCSTDPAVVDFANHGFVARVEKPYRIQDLGTIIRDALRN